MTRTRARSNSRTALRFDQKLVLNQWMLSLIGHSDFKQLSDAMRHVEEGLDENDTHYYLYHMRTLPGLELMPWELLLRYDQNIVRHTRRISHRRPEPVRWKYFQWLTLLFTEIYLDRFFQDPEQLLADVNNFLIGFNDGRAQRDQLPSYTLDDLTKIAFWNATGSGKTLLMHVNILQYLHYLEEHGRTKDFNRILLLTPNEGLSRQHLEEFQLSDIQAELFDKDQGGLFRGDSVEILDIHKLKEDAGEKTVAIDSFEGNNLVLVDEGHRGASASDIGRWMQARDRLCEHGFSFEYSATFGQAMRQAGALHDRYAKCILFDYSYKYFYNDGYGKDYRILNLADDSDEERRNLYLSACLLTFYEQQKLYRERKQQFRHFLLEPPLLVFVGNTVNAVRTESGRTVSDVVDVLLFLSRLVKNRRQTTEWLQRLLSGRPGLLDQRGNEIFATAFPFLIELGMTADELYDDILAMVFNASAPAALHVEDLKGVDGEVALRLGDNEPFGVINVGDASKLCGLCEEHPSDLVVTERSFSSSMFSTLNNEESPINVLIGSKKFTEGWNSWRVSTMGLLNVGRSAGAEIIQLFGRGVRLKGFNMSLKRSSELAVQRPKHIGLLETLNIFGVRAQYMDQFRDYLEQEGVGKADGETTVITIPTQKTLGDARLTTLRLQDGVNFKRSGKKPTAGEVFDKLYQNRVELNWYPMIQARQSRGARKTDDFAVLHQCQFTEKHIGFMDMRAIWFELQQFKNEKRWYNLNLPFESIPKLLTDPDWYVLKVPEEEMQPGSFARVRRWQQMAVALLRLYIERFYHHEKAAYENQFLEYKALRDDDSNLVDEYQFTVQESGDTYQSELTRLSESLQEGTFTDDWTYGNVQAIKFDRHLYQPLFAVSRGDVLKVTPVSLNEGESSFILDLRSYYNQNSELFADKPMYLLRNMSRGRGIGFFEAGNFYPDFILWLLVDDKEYVTFIDPKGLIHTKGPSDPKISFHAAIKERERQLGNPRVILNSFILSNTELRKIDWWDGGMTEEDFARRHVLFQKPGDLGYIQALFDRILSHRM